MYFHPSRGNGCARSPRRGATLIEVVTAILTLGIAIPPLVGLFTEVAANSPAAEKGIRPGDVIVEVAQEAVATPADVRGAVAKAKEEQRKSVLMLVQSGENLRFVAVKIEE